jgi:hypothetical protein
MDRKQAQRFRGGSGPACRVDAESSSRSRRACPGGHEAHYSGVAYIDPLAAGALAMLDDLMNRVWAADQPSVVGHLAAVAGCSRPRKSCVATFLIRYVLGDRTLERCQRWENPEPAPCRRPHPLHAAALRYRCMETSRANDCNSQPRKMMGQPSLTYHLGPAG